MSILTSCSTFGCVVAVNVAVTEWLNKVFKVEKRWVKQVISWSTPIVLSIVGLIFGVGLFADYGTLTDWRAWVSVILTGFGMGLASNGVYEIDYVQTLLNVITTFISKLGKKNPTPVATNLGTVPANDCNIEELHASVLENPVVEEVVTISETVNNSDPDAIAPVVKKKRAPRKKKETTENA